MSTVGVETSRGSCSLSALTHIPSAATDSKYRTPCGPCPNFNRCISTRTQPFLWLSSTFGLAQYSLARKTIQYTLHGLPFPGVNVASHVPALTFGRISRLSVGISPLGFGAGRCQCLFNLHFHRGTLGSPLGPLVGKEKIEYWPRSKECSTDSAQYFSPCNPGAIFGLFARPHASSSHLSPCLPSP